MAKRRFNTTGVCDPRRHYMVDIRGRLEEIEEIQQGGWLKIY